jgi:malate dehydrogenase (oxaloacetate-decarboxylating)
MPLLNKGSAFDDRERAAFNLIGLLPQDVETIEQQADRAYDQYCKYEQDLNKHIFLRGIQDDNETLFFRLVEEHLEEMLPIIYTPVVGRACQEFSKIYRNHRGLFISYPNRDYMDDMIRSATKDNVKVIVVTDGERILGLGDQGIGGMGIPIGKLSLYSACGGVSPAYTLPVVLDVGTNNQELLDDPMYMGWRHERITGEEYEAFVDLFVRAIRRRWPHVLLQFEDFAQQHANPLLRRYRDQMCCFNDDIQGTAAVAVGTLLAACKTKNEYIAEQTLVIAGAGSAGCGIAEQSIVAMVDAGLSEADARSRVFMIDKNGLITDDMTGLYDFQARLAQPAGRVSGWKGIQESPLLSVVDNGEPTVLIGVTGQRGLFSEAIIKRMHGRCRHPFILPLSNPISKVEATPEEILTWTNGEALVATGSPFDPVEINGEKIPIAQCNNVYIFPGLGLGIVSARANRVTDKMLMAASRTLAEHSPLALQGEGKLLPALGDVQAFSEAIAQAVAVQAQEDGVALQSSEDFIHRSVERQFCHPVYRKYRRAAF